jgi:hypothetical protein
MKTLTSNVERVREKYGQRKTEIQKEVIAAHWQLVHERARLLLLKEIQMDGPDLFPEVKADLSDENIERVLKPYADKVRELTKELSTLENRRLKLLREAVDADKCQTLLNFE